MTKPRLNRQADPGPRLLEPRRRTYVPHDAVLPAQPTEVAAVGRTKSTPTATAPAPVLRSRLVAALGRDDGHGALLLAAHLARSAA
ncbi:hypothetical protein ABT063_15555 [Streptomyces sp. NPDC002838]|uniref:hypothetical protein n=1 Tax=Streptomyces sp. NPDC002838 TaxID=3154436 RepID=UPI0033235486